MKTKVKIMGIAAAESKSRKAQAFANIRNRIFEETKII